MTKFDEFGVSEHFAELRCKKTAEGNVYQWRSQGEGLSPLFTSREEAEAYSGPLLPHPTIEPIPVP